MRIARMLAVALVWLALAQPGWGQTGPAPDPSAAVDVGTRVGQALLREIETMDLRTLRSRLVIGTPGEARRELRELVMLGARRMVDAVVRLVATPDSQQQVNDLTDTLVDYDAVVGDLLARGIREDVARTRDPVELKAVLARVVAAGAAAGSDGMQRQFRRIQTQARVASDQGTVAILRSVVAIHYARNDGRFPSSKDEVRSLYQASTGRSIEFACPGNDFTYDAATGAVELTVSQPEHCSP